VDLPGELASYIRDNTQNYGKAKLVLKRNKFWVESPHREVLTALLEDEDVALVGGGGYKGVCLRGSQARGGGQKEVWRKDKRAFN
jgi:DNA excision repair protein ERCC-3